MWGKCWQQHRVVMCRICWHIYMFSTINEEHLFWPKFFAFLGEQYVEKKTEVPWHTHLPIHTIISDQVQNHSTNFMPLLSLSPIKLLQEKINHTISMELSRFFCAEFLKMLIFEVSITNRTMMYEYFYGTHEGKDEKCTGTLHKYDLWPPMKKKITWTIRTHQHSYLNGRIWNDYCRAQARFQKASVLFIFCRWHYSNI